MKIHKIVSVKIDLDGWGRKLFFENGTILLRKKVWKRKIQRLDYMAVYSLRDTIKMRKKNMKSKALKCKRNLVCTSYRTKIIGPDGDVMEVTVYLKEQTRKNQKGEQGKRGKKRQHNKEEKYFSVVTVKGKEHYYPFKINCFDAKLCNSQKDSKDVTLIDSFSCNLIKLQKKIGSGGLGNVHERSNTIKLGHKQCNLVTKVNKDKIEITEKGFEEVISCLEEAKKLSLFHGKRSKSVLSLSHFGFRVFEDGIYTYTDTPRMDGTMEVFKDIFEKIIEEQDKESFNMVINYLFSKLLDSLIVFHKQKQIHNDLKLANIFLSVKGNKIKDISQLSPKEFINKLIKKEKLTPVLGDLGATVSQDTTKDVTQGSPHNMPPERAYYTEEEKSINTQAGDIWSIAITILKLIIPDNKHFKTHPMRLFFLLADIYAKFVKKDKVSKKVEAKRYHIIDQLLAGLKAHPLVDKRLYGIISEMLKLNYKDRPTAKKLRQKYFSKPLVKKTEYFSEEEKLEAKAIAIGTFESKAKLKKFKLRHGENYIAELKIIIEKSKQPEEEEDSEEWSCESDSNE
ncbi:hypothetical protein ACFLZV_05955 [Candidatus Margulisiibacteriota bacterium]